MAYYTFLITGHWERNLTGIKPTCRLDVLVGVPLDLSTLTGMSCIGTYGETCKSDNVSKYCFLIVAFQLLWHEELVSWKKTVNS